MNSILDFHTHRADAVDALISVDARQFAPQPGKWYSVGFHPWHGVNRLTEADFELLAACARHGQVLAIGETGMDKLRGGSLDLQAQAFVRHLQVAATVGKPVVVHCVRAAQDILDCRRRNRLDDVQLAIHGFRNNERVAHMLLDAGCYLSYGLRFNAAALMATPPDRLLIETDDNAASIRDVARQVAQTLGLTLQDVVGHTNANYHRLLHPSAGIQTRYHQETDISNIPS